MISPKLKNSHLPSRSLWQQRLIITVFCGIICLGMNLLAGCVSTEVTAKENHTSPREQRIINSIEKRIYLDVSLEYLDSYDLPQQTFEQTSVGGLSGITYDRQRNLFYVLSDDPSNFAPARFYTLEINFNRNRPTSPKIDNIKITKVTNLIAEDGQTFALNTINPEAIAFLPPNEIFVASEGVSAYGIDPFIQKFELETGRWLKSLPIPQRYLPNSANESDAKGVQNNLGFESLTLKANPGEPYRIFTATEAPLIQDKETEDSNLTMKNRFLHYLVGDGEPVLIAEHYYPLERGGRWSITNGLTDLLVLDQGGHFLSLERSLGFLGYGAKIFQLATGSATDTSNIVSLKGNLKGIEPIKKKLLLDLNTLGVALDNLEGMTLGPKLPDGSQTLIVISDNNFDTQQANQFLLFKLKIK